MKLLKSVFGPLYPFLCKELMEPVILYTPGYSSVKRKFWMMLHSNVLWLPKEYLWLGIAASGSQPPQTDVLCTV